MAAERVFEEKKSYDYDNQKAFQLSIFHWLLNRVNFLTPLAIIKE